MTGQFRAWRFVHPDFDVPGLAAGLQIAASGGIDMVQDRDSIRQSLLLLISTMPGERVMRPEYGCYLYRLIFDPNDDTTAGLAIHYVRSAIERWEPRIEIQRLDAVRNEEEPGRLDISLEYRIRPTGNMDQLLVGVQVRP